MRQANWKAALQHPVLTTHYAGRKKPIISMACQVMMRFRAVKEMT